MWDDLFKDVKNYKIGQTLRIRLPNDYNLTETKAMNMMDDVERTKRQQRLDCIRLAVDLRRSTGETDAKKIVNDAKAMYKFVKGK